jgi:hypothetical protein
MSDQTFTKSQLIRYAAMYGRYRESIAKLKVLKATPPNIARVNQLIESAEQAVKSAADMVLSCQSEFGFVHDKEELKEAAGYNEPAGLFS